MIKESQFNEADAVFRETVPAGDYFLHRIEKGQTFR
ncbi:MAG TPA: urea carboxylase, partial [Oceanospirillales bacterium]|nr:urea carboxylase [Oceanospirillales bacterium]